MSELSHAHAHAREHSHTRDLHTRAFTDTRVHASIRTRAHASIRTRSHAHTRAFAHAHTRAFAHAHNCPTPGICILLTMPHFDALKIYSCGNHCEKRKNCLKQAIYPFITMFSSLNGTYFSF